MARTTGFLTRSIALWRLYTNETAINAKYTDSNIIGFLQSSYQTVLGEIYRAIPLGETLVIVPQTYCDIELGASTSDQTYALPPYIERIFAVKLLDSESEEVCTLRSRGMQHPDGKGIRIEGNMLWVKEGELDAGYYVRIEYAPSAAPCLHEGTAAAVSATGTTITLATTPTVGELDTHPNAYAGCRVRILSASTNNYVQERPIASYAHTTLVATLGEPFSPIPSGATITYEICPALLDQEMDRVVTLHATLDMLAVEDQATRYKLMKDRLANAMRELRLKYGQRDQQSGGQVSRSRYVK